MLMPLHSFVLVSQIQVVDCLPLIMLDGEIVSKGAYLDKDALGAKVGIEITGGAAPSCCGPSEDETETKKEETSACCG